MLLLNLETRIGLAYSKESSTAILLRVSFFSKLNATQKGLVLVLVPLAFELFFVVAFLTLLTNAEHDFKRIEHAKQVVVEMQKLLDLGLRTSMVVVDPRVKDKAIKINEMRALASHMSQTDSFGDISASNNPELTEVLRESEAGRKGILKFLAQCINDLESAPPGLDSPGLARRYEQVRRLLQEYERLSKTVISLETRLFEEHPREVKRFQQETTLLIASMLLIGTLSSALLVKVFSQDISRRLTDIGVKAQELAFGRAPAPADGSDEIAQLDRVICDAGATLVESRLRETAILHNSADVLLSLDQRLRIDDVGESCHQLWHYAPADLRGLSLLQLIETAHLESVRTAFARIAEGSNVGQIESVVRTKGEAPKNTLFSVRWAPSQSMFYCAAHDITDLRNVEMLRRRFLAIASHDLRTPMSSVALILSLLSSQKREPLAQGVLTEIEKALSSANRLTELVNDFLELEKFEAGRSSLEITSMSALDVCQLAEETLSASIERLGIEIDYPKKDCIILADESRILKVMETLLSNALVRSPSGSSIDVSLITGEGYATIGITDPGPAVSNQKAEVMFERFSLSDDSDVNRSGLGFAIAKAIITAHDGKIGVTSESGSTTFFFTVPLETASVDKEEA